jgi:hypothetical protein
MTTNKYATLRGTIARAKRNDCQKVVMRVTLAEELLGSCQKQRSGSRSWKQYWHVIGAGQFVLVLTGLIIATLATTPTRAKAPSESKARINNGESN